MALTLRASVGTEAVLRDFDRYGFQTLLGAGTKDAEWADTLSVGETNITVTALDISRFLQAIGKQGMMVSLNTKVRPAIRRVMQEKTALRLQSAMRDVVQRGTATSIATALAGTGWQMGGKTGSGPGPASNISELDGWFAGLIFDPQGKARFTIATFVKHGGRGGNAARVSAEMAHFLITENGAIDRKR
jgi:membrane peptidoglycan carboxypeptidase